MWAEGGVAAGAEEVVEGDWSRRVHHGLHAPARARAVELDRHR
jgi:hypothetical protein